MKKIAILGTVGIPASYGGFETLVENLVKFQNTKQLPTNILVYCSAKNYPEKKASYMGAKLKYIRLNANGASSILYDIVSLLSAVLNRYEVILLLGVSGSIALPFIKIFTQTRVITNIDGLEWKRAKWNMPARWFLRLSEYLAVRYSNEIITDNQGIADYVVDVYGRKSHVIAYGGDHAVAVNKKPLISYKLPGRYAFALCRIEPENNVDMILQAFEGNNNLPIVFVGNWDNSIYGRDLRQRYAGLSHIQLLDPIYDTGILRGLREKAVLYIHGHSAGGTNPSLVEMMHFGVPVMAFDCIYNRYTTEGQALYFSSSNELRRKLNNINEQKCSEIACNMIRIAKKRYTWDEIGEAYFKILIQ